MLQPPPPPPPPPLVPAEPLLPPPPPLPPVPPAGQPPASGAAHRRVNVQKAMLQVAPRALHLQSSSVVHQPSMPFAYWPAGLHAIVPGLVFQSHTSPPQAVFGQSSSFTQVCADAAPAANRHTS